MIPLMKNAFLNEAATKEALAQFILQADRLSMGERCARFEDEFADRMSTYAKSCLAKVETAARDRGLACESIHVAAAKPYQAIIDTAAARGCDLIVVGAHGRRGLAGLVLGSETVKVLTHSKIPILVYRG